MRLLGSFFQIFPKCSRGNPLCKEGFPEPLPRNLKILISITKKHTCRQKQACLTIKLSRTASCARFNAMYANFSRDSKSAAFAGAQPRAHPSFGVRARLQPRQRRGENRQSARSGSGTGGKFILFAAPRKWLWRKRQGLLCSCSVCPAAFGHNLFPQAPPRLSLSGAHAT